MTRLRRTRVWATAALALSCVSCGKGDPEAQAAAPKGATTAATADSAPAAAVPAGPLADRAPAQIRGLYINAYAAGSRARLPKLIAMADNTEINTFVVDVKTERGVHFDTQVPLAKELQQKGENTLHNLKTLTDTLHAHHIWTIARMVVFKDPILSKARPDWSIRKAGGGLWVDKAGNTWVSAWDSNVWDYNLSIAEEVAKAGFDEIQFDYVRFPEPYASLPPQVHPKAKGNRTDAIAAFLNRAKARLHPLGVPVSADVFGLSPNDPQDVNIGQQWETISATADHVLPMMYPSHYLPTHLPGVKSPDTMPYETLYKSAGMAKLRTDRLREGGVKPARIIPWLQAFTATWVHPHLEYGAQQLRDQKRGVYDVGLDDWVLWHPGSKYEPVLAGLDKETQSHASRSYTPPKDVLSVVNMFEKQGTKSARDRAIQQAHGDTTDPKAAQAAKTGKAE